MPAQAIHAHRIYTRSPKTELEKVENLGKVDKTLNIGQRFWRLRISEGTCKNTCIDFRVFNCWLSQDTSHFHKALKYFSRYQMAPRKTRESLQKTVVLCLDCFLTLSWPPQICFWKVRMLFEAFFRAHGIVSLPCVMPWEFLRPQHCFWKRFGGCICLYLIKRVPWRTTLRNLWIFM